jgi:putative transposase
MGEHISALRLRKVERGGGCPRFRCWEPGAWVASALATRFLLQSVAMPTGLKRICGRGHLHFLTFSCYKRLPFLKTARSRDVFLQELGRLRAELGFRIIGYVVMPEHVHLLINEPSGATPSTVLHRLKLRVAKRLRKRRRRVRAGQISLPFEECKEAPQPFWQPRFHDFNVYSAGKREEKLHYMHANPTKRGLVSHPRDWPWSSWAFYHGQTALLTMDSADQQIHTPRPRFPTPEPGAPSGFRENFWPARRVPERTAPAARTL